MSVDPIGFEAGDVNLYRYVGNTPVLVIDPTGFERVPFGHGYDIDDDSFIVSTLLPYKVDGITLVQLYELQDEIEVIAPTIVYYDVGGIYQQLGEKIASLGPNGYWGKTSAELLGRRLHQKTGVDKDDNGCYWVWSEFRGEFYIKNLTVTLPRWTDYGNASQAQQQAWDTAMSALRNHEAWHVYRLYYFPSKVIIVASKQTCNRQEAIGLRFKVMRAASQRFNDWLLVRIAFWNLREAAYDARTNHGGNTGVVLPQVL